MTIKDLAFIELVSTGEEIRLNTSHVVEVLVHGLKANGNN